MNSLVSKKIGSVGLLMLFSLGGCAVTQRHAPPLSELPPDNGAEAIVFPLSEKVETRKATQPVSSPPAHHAEWEVTFFSEASSLASALDQQWGHSFCPTNGLHLFIPHGGQPTTAMEALVLHPYNLLSKHWGIEFLVETGNERMVEATATHAVEITHGVNLRLNFGAETVFEPEAVRTGWAVGARFYLSNLSSLRN